MVTRDDNEEEWVFRTAQAAFLRRLDAAGHLDHGDRCSFGVFPADTLSDREKIVQDAAACTGLSLLLRPEEPAQA